jgi:hypothetical protein
MPSGNPFSFLLSTGILFRRSTGIPFRRSAGILSRCYRGILVALLFAYPSLAAALEPNDLWPGLGKSAVVSVYTSHRSCGNYEFREEPQSIGWDAHLYGRSASVDIQFEHDTASSILIVLFLEPGDDGSTLFRSLAEERIRELGAPMGSTFLSGSAGSGSAGSGSAGSGKASSGNTDPDKSTEDSSRGADTLEWCKDDHLIRLQRWPATPRGQIHISRTYLW